MKEVSSDARALGIRAEMNSRRCWEAELESGSGNEPKEPTNLERREEDSDRRGASSTLTTARSRSHSERDGGESQRKRGDMRDREREGSSVSPLRVILQFVFDDVQQFVSGIQREGETR